MDKYRVSLTAEERTELEQFVSRGKAAARKLTHARILLLADDSRGDEHADGAIGAALGTSLRTVARVRQQLVTDGIDVSQMHEPDPETPIEETLGALNDLVRDGKVRWIGSSNFSGEQIGAAEEVAHGAGLHRFVSAQNEYSLVEREAEDDVLPSCETRGVGFLPYFPLASGLLTGKYTRGAEATEGRLAGREIAAEQWDRVEALQRFADARGISLLEVAVGGLLAMPAVTSVIAGATTPEQVRANVAAGVWEPTDDDVEELRALR